MDWGLLIIWAGGFIIGFSVGFLVRALILIDKEG